MTQRDKKPDPKANQRTTSEKPTVKDLEGRKSEGIKGGAGDSGSPRERIAVNHNEVMAATAR
jgi:hypothetical protein